MSAPSPSRRGAARHSELFDALVELLLTEGFAHLTLDDLAARLRCSKRTLYALAGSKEQLVRAAVVHFFEQATSRVEAAVAARTDPEQRLAAYLRAVADELAAASPRFMDDLAAFPPAAEVYARNTEAAARRVGELIGEGVDAGVFRAVPVSFAAEVITVTMVAIQQRRIATATGLGDAEAYEALASLLLNGLTRPAPAAHPQDEGQVGSA
ncbi:TetR/AcrR family transcriptional regulator [Actinomycetospora cinnamomea]|uniref:TetR family transcriptional regulator n=1 Tax=Actinomycetospora cinnamomea TaxID=663609 RepID=A0A2U1EA29_9PSEU|nr:TetR/AcrR family transcriptional regulator [Actinomycetospora cinnamomea]PVY96732.1 TetR family transcriptional regulator [Actinomycetospora cinnamomea]